MLNIAMGLQLDGFSAFPGLKRASITSSRYTMSNGIFWLSVCTACNRVYMQQNKIFQLMHNSETTNL